jgi:hypothetical protein
LSGLLSVRVISLFFSLFLGIEPLDKESVELDEEYHSKVDVVVQNNVEELSETILSEWCDQHHVAKISKFLIINK